jgi:hypothetical protein
MKLMLKTKTKKLLLLLLPFVLLGCSPKLMQTINQEPVFECYFNSVEELQEKFYIVDNEFYNENPVLFRADMLEITSEGLVIQCKKEQGTATTWQKTGEYHWVSGCIATWNKDSTWNRFARAGGTWVIEAVFPETWAALWLLHPDYYVEETGKNHIIPEVDIAENNGRGAIENIVHYGWHSEKYALFERLRKMHPYDGKMHEYAVRILPDGYLFYLDGRMVNSLRSTDPSFSSNQPKYLIINNAAKAPYLQESEFVIKSVKYYR